MDASTDALVTIQAMPVTVTVNGSAWSGRVPAEEVLLEFLRYRLGLTGTKRSCESEVCGACTVLVDGRPVSSCSYLAFEVDGKSVLTIEGLGSANRLDPIQEAFIRNMGFQCGYTALPGRSWPRKACSWRIAPRPTKRSPSGSPVTRAAADATPRLPRQSWKRQSRRTVRGAPGWRRGSD